MGGTEINEALRLETKMILLFVALVYTKPAESPADAIVRLAARIDDIHVCSDDFSIGECCEMSTSWCLAETALRLAARTADKAYFISDVLCYWLSPIDKLAVAMRAIVWTYFRVMSTAMLGALAIGCSVLGYHSYALWTALTATGDAWISIGVEIGRLLVDVATSDAMLLVLATIGAALSISWTALTLAYGWPDRTIVFIGVVRGLLRVVWLAVRSVLMLAWTVMSICLVAPLVPNLDFVAMRAIWLPTPTK